MNSWHKMAIASLLVHLVVALLMGAVLVGFISLIGLLL